MLRDLRLALRHVHRALRARDLRRLHPAQLQHRRAVLRGELVERLLQLAVLALRRLQLLLEALVLEVQRLGALEPHDVGRARCEVGRRALLAACSRRSSTYAGSTMATAGEGKRIHMRALGRSTPEGVSNKPFPAISLWAPTPTE